MKKLVLLLFLTGAYVQAQDTPRAMLRTRLEPAGPVLVGQPVRLYVDVLVTTWLTGAPQFPQLELDGALVILPDERAINLTERIDGTTWFGLKRSYLIYPQEPREYRTPAGTVVVGYSQAGEPARLPLEQHTFSARVPDEARALGYFIATTDFRMEQRIDPQPKDLKTGDSVRRVITMTADNTFAMFLPPVTFEPEEGLALYPDPPKLTDRSEDRLGFQGGQRTDSAIYIIEKEGEYRLPPVEVYWWDLQAGRMRLATLPAVEFQAKPNPDFIPEIPLPAEEEVADIPAPVKETWVDIAKRWAVPTVILLAVLWLTLRYLPGLAQRIRYWVKKRRQLHADSEAAAFEQFRRADRAGNAGASVKWLYRWLDRIMPMGGIVTLRGFARESGDMELYEELDSIETELFHADAETGKLHNARTFNDVFRKARKNILRKHRENRIQTGSLPGLNP